MRSDSVPLSRQPNGSSTRLYGIKRVTVEFLNGSTNVNSSLVYFNADTNDWQYACGSAVAAGTYTSIRISLNFHYTRNHCYYDGVQLYREEFSQAYSYDTNGNLTGYKSLIGQQNSFEYNSTNDVTKSTDPRGNSTTYTYDTKHNLTGSESAEHVKSAYTVNSRGQTTKTTVGDASLSVETEAAYDSDTALTENVTDARGKTVGYDYDSATRATTQITDPKGNTSTYVYGNAIAMHRLASITSTGLGAVLYTYDTYGKLIKISRGTTEYNLTYDTWNRPLETKVGTTALSTNTYDSYGKLLTVTYANGFSARYEYDNLDRVSKIYQTENNTESLVYEMIYNGEGDLYELRNYRTLRASFFDYDHAGRCMASKERSFSLSGSTISYGNMISSYAYKYDECNNLTKLTCSVASSTWSTTYTYDKDNRPKTTTLSNGKVITNTYDALGRLASRKIGLNSDYITTLTYVPGNGTNKTTGLVSAYQNGSDAAYSYTYDDNGNITEITQGSTSITYEYDTANRLTRENNGVTNETVTYEYDTWGNILNRKVYAYTTGDLTNVPYTEIEYEYTNSAWGDQLTSYDNVSITYDGMGNPLTYRGYNFGWRGKQLVSAGNGTDTITYEYNEDGLRQKKTVNNVDTDYFYNGSVLIGMQRGTDKLLFSYDASGNVVSVDFNGTEYYYLRNAQGDVVKLIDGSGVVVVEYTYDTWGKEVQTTGSLAGTLGLFQPFRYRGYVYDWETGFYYLQSRYYDPTTGRFISADVLLSTGQGVLGHNAYAYCLDNPVIMCDPSGFSPVDPKIKLLTPPIKTGISGIIDAIKDYQSRISSIGVYNCADDVAIAIAPQLYETTMQTNEECMAGIYSINCLFGRVYFAGPILSGMHDNVIIPTLASYALDSAVSTWTYGCIRMEGFIHSHPYCNGHINDEFSGFIGDEGAASLTGSCYLIEPEGRALYKISSWDVGIAYLQGKTTAQQMDQYRIYSYPFLMPYKDQYECR